MHEGKIPHLLVGVKKVIVYDISVIIKNFVLIFYVADLHVEHQLCRSYSFLSTLLKIHI